MKLPICTAVHPAGGVPVALRVVINTRSSAFVVEMVRLPPVLEAGNDPFGSKADEGQVPAPLIPNA
jgi:hypothetical protein